MEVQLFASTKASYGCLDSVTQQTFADQLNSNKAKQNAKKSEAGLTAARLCLWRYSLNLLRR